MNDWSAPVRVGFNSQSPEGVAVARDCKAYFIARRLWHSRRLGSDKMASEYWSWGHGGIGSLARPEAGSQELFSEVSSVSC